MATWPTSPASTANLDAGSDRPSLARADLKNNVDNVNAIIDMFNITASPSNNSILKYSTSTSQFELTADADVNTTYSISAETGSGGTNLRLTDSSAGTDDVLFANGTGITVSRTDANTITIASTVTDTNTTYSISAVTDGADANIRLTGSDASTDDIQLVAGTNISLAVTSAGAIQINNSASAGMTGFTAAGDSGSSQTISDGNTLTISGGTGLSSVASATDTITLNLDDTAVTPASYTIGSFTVDAQGRLTAASSASTTGSGNVVLATSPTLTTPLLGTPTSGTLTNCTVDGTNQIGYRDLPAVGTKTSSYQLTTGDVGKYVQVGSGGSITIPDATFAEGDVVVIANNHSSAITITCTITTAYIAGTDTDKATVSLATRGLCNILFLSGTACIISGNIS